MIKAKLGPAILLAVLLIGLGASRSFSQTGASPVTFSVNPVIFESGQASSAFVCVTATDISALSLTHGDTFTFMFPASVGALTSVSTPVAVNSSTLTPGDFSGSVKTSSGLVTRTYTGPGQAFRYGDSVCLTVNFTAAVTSGSGDVAFSSRFTTTINGDSPFVILSVVNFPTGPSGVSGPTGPMG